MSHIDPDDLAMAALESLALDEDEAQHLRECAQCSAELSALEHTVGIARRARTEELAAPDPRVWDAIRAEIATEPAPDAQVVGASAAPEVSGRDHVQRGSRLRTRILLLGSGLIVTAAAVALVVTLTVPRPVDIATAVLDAFPDHPGAAGTAALEREPDGSERVVVDLDADLRDDGFREVWLLTEDGTALVSLGVLEGSGGTFTVPADVDTDRFTVVDISQEPDDGDSTHSGDSIVRGTLERS
jgi:hypothetical protein